MVVWWREYELAVQNEESGGEVGEEGEGWLRKIRTLASPHLRTNLSPFTKDFRVEVQHNESIDSFLGCLDGFGCWGDYD